MNDLAKFLLVFFSFAGFMIYSCYDMYHQNKTLSADFKARAESVCSSGTPIYTLEDIYVKHLISSKTSTEVSCVDHTGKVQETFIIKDIDINRK